MLLGWNKHQLNNKYNLWKKKRQIFLVICLFNIVLELGKMDLWINICKVLQELYL